jgi:hypothetical protein
MWSINWILTFHLLITKYSNTHISKRWKSCMESLPLKKITFYHKNEWQYNHEQYNSKPINRPHFGVCPNSAYVLPTSHVVVSLCYMIKFNVKWLLLGNHKYKSWYSRSPTPKGLLCHVFCKVCSMLSIYFNHADVLK